MIAPLLDQSIPLDDLADRYAFLDPASGRGRLPIKRVRARSAIVVLAADALSRIFVLESWADRCSTDRLIDRVFETQARWSLRTFGVEANAMQSLFVDTLVLRARERGVRLPIRAVDQSTRLDKAWRIRTAIQPVLADGRLFVQSSSVELLTELRSFPMSATKDLVDALASAIALIPARLAAHQRSSERDALAAYLRADGVSAWQIERRLAEYDRTAEEARRS